MTTSTTKRWALYSTKTLTIMKRTFATREDARNAKGVTHKIYDTRNGIFVR